MIFGSWKEKKANKKGDRTVRERDQSENRFRFAERSKRFSKIQKIKLRSKSDRQALTLSNAEHAAAMMAAESADAQSDATVRITA